MAKKSKQRTVSFDEHIGSKIRQRRLADGISQTTLGEALDVSFQQIQKYETGKNRMSAEQLWLACRFLKLPISSICEGVVPEMCTPPRRPKMTR
jgi:transcriptional regulator with XRE-family HTH domain